ncbi:hypothetical protein [Halobacillus sp. KGW1]|uniref:phage head-tail connector protein n=1 Tax=Halobacillus sp. KGW1 TaxID=1793726 RepID=UPI0007820315|nr:hypothetical protein [Halobacillus sp. KGW1]
MIDKVKPALRVSTDDPGILSEIEGLIAAARLDLIQAGVSPAKAEDDGDALIERAIVTYCKANFGYDNPEAVRFHDSYVMLKQHLCLYGDYKEVSTGEA